MNADPLSSGSFIEQLEALLLAPYPIVELRTHEENRALEHLERLVDKHDLAIREWSPVTDFSGDRHDGCFEAALDAVESTDQTGVVFVFKDAAHFFQKAVHCRRVRELAENLANRDRTLVFVGADSVRATQLQKDIVSCRLPLPGWDAVARIADAVFDDDELDGTRQLLVRGALGLTAKEARRALHRVRMQWRKARRHNAPFDVHAALLDEKKRRLEQSDIVDFVSVDRDLQQVGGLEVLKNWLRERKSALSPEARQYGLPVPKGLLLLGVQGCGKSLMAKVIGNYWDLPVVRLDLGSIFEGRQSPEQALSEAIDMSTAIAPSVLWVDEIDKGLGTRSSGRAERVLGQLLTWQQEKTEPVFFVATANQVEVLPPEMLRRGRFDDIFFLDLPDNTARREILEIHLLDRGIELDDEIIDDLAAKAEFFSGAELEQVVISAMHTAFSDDRSVRKRDLERAIEEFVPLYRLREQQIKSLRQWAQGRARPASRERKLLDYFE